ncbi:MAG: response regulator [Deltaproteobacteria bacterium]|nr:response regulator [Deltaproteobacteria bacterium]
MTDPASLPNNPTEVTSLQGQVASLQEQVASLQEQVAKQHGEERYRQAFEHSVAAIYVFDNNKSFIDTNQAGIELLGYSKDELLQMSIPDVDIDPAAVRPAHNAVFSAGQTIKLEHRLRHKDGRVVTVLNNSRTLTSADGTIIGVQSTLMDISEQKALEKKNRALEQEVRRTRQLETVGTLTGGIAHDFNNLLMPIVAYAEMALTRTKASTPLHADLKAIQQAAHRATDLVKRIILFSHPHQAGRKPVKLQNVAEEAIQLVRPTAPASVTIQQTIDPSCDFVLADESQLHQVIMNLCGNAFHAMVATKGQLDLDVRQLELTDSDDDRAGGLAEGLAEGRYVRLSVTDNGQGMDAATLERAFEPFFSTKPVDQGTGLGLSVVHSIVQNHDGRIFMHSTLGEGTQVQIYFPVPDIKHAPKSAISTHTPGGCESILIVDDDPVVATVVSKLLRELGYHPTTFTDGLKALDELQKHPESYDLLLTDLTMPAISGLDLSQAAVEVKRTLPIVLMTGYANHLAPDDIKRCGVDSVIPKPITRAELATGIRRVLDLVS